MRAVVTKKELVKGLKPMLATVKQVPKAPKIMQCVLIQTGDDSLTLTARACDTCISLKIPAQVLEEGELCLDVRALITFVKSAPNADIVIESEGDGAKMYAPPATVHLEGFPAQEYPGQEELTEGTDVQADAAWFLKCLEDCSHALPHPKTTDIDAIMGVHLCTSKMGLDMVATDTHRLVKRRLLCDVGELKATIPAEVVRLLLPLDYDTDVFMRVSEDRMQITLGRATVSCVNDAGYHQYPNYERVIPAVSHMEHKVRIDPRTVRALVKQVAPYAKGDMERVTLSVSPDKLTVEANGQFGMWTRAETDCKEYRVAFNSGYLLDAMSSLANEPEVNWYFGSPLGPSVLLTDSGDKEVIMPMQMREAA